MIQGAAYGFYTCDSEEERLTILYPEDLPILVTVNSSPSITYFGKNGRWQVITIPDLEGNDGKLLKLVDGVVSWAASGSGGYDGDPTVIIQDATHRFVSDTEKATWNGKDAGGSAATALSSANGYTDSEILSLSSSVTTALSGKANSLGSDDNYVTDAEKIKLSNLSGTNTGDQDLNGLLTKNVSITGATKTKITYDSNGLVTSGADATTSDISDSSNKRYVTDAQQTVISNTSGANSGDETASGIRTKLGITTLSGSNTGDNATNTQYSGLASSKQEALISGTNIKTVNGFSLLGSGNLTVSASITEVEIDVGATPVQESSIAVADAGVSVTSKIIGGIAYKAPTGKDLDELEMDAIELKFEPGTGTFNVHIKGMEGYISDKFIIWYLIA